MVIPINEAVAKYRDYINAAHRAKEAIERYGFSVQVMNGFELGEEWVIVDRERVIAEAMWNVPYMLSFKPYVAQKEKEFFIENIKSLSDWEDLLSDITQSVTQISINS